MGLAVTKQAARWLKLSVDESRILQMGMEVEG
jgi:hypothetical protein